MVDVNTSAAFEAEKLVGSIPKYATFKKRSITTMMTVLSLYAGK